MNLLDQNNRIIFLLLAIWELTWKGYALWFAAKGNQRNWFIGILLINSLGLVPIFYLLFYQKGIFKEVTFLSNILKRKKP